MTANPYERVIALINEQIDSIQDSYIRACKLDAPLLVLKFASQEKALDELKERITDEFELEKAAEDI